jgi:hypothetical protein
MRTDRHDEDNSIFRSLKLTENRGGIVCYKMLVKMKNKNNNINRGYYYYYY